MPPELIQRLDSICEEIGHGITRTALIEWACQWYAAAYEANENRPLSQSDMADIVAAAEIMGIPKQEVLRMAAEIGLEHLHRVGYNIAAPILDASKKAAP